MNLHLMPDDKFLDGFIAKMESVDKPGNNVYVVYSREYPDRFRYIKDARAVFAPVGSTLFQQLTANMSRYDKIVIHYLARKIWDFVATIPRGSKVWWRFWGSDFYFSPGIFGRFLYDKHTKSLIREPLTPQGLRLRFWRYLQNRKRLLSHRLACERVDAILHWNQVDYELIRQFYPQCKATFVDSHYWGVAHFPPLSECALPPSCASLAKRKIILVGNSGTPENNHLAVFRRLAKLKLKDDVAVVCPLSYGDPDYIQKISELGKAVLRSRFVPLLDFLDEKSYYGLLAHVEIAFMNHMRTQAGGNVLALLWYGKKVFMNSQSTLFKMLKEGKCSVYDIETAHTSEEIFNPLTAEEKKLCCSYLNTKFGEEAVNTAYEAIIRN